jgi:UDP-N-acetylmuramoylalanine--D-glutamate ligase
MPPAASPISPPPAPCPARTTCRTPPRPPPWRARLGLPRGGDRRGHRQLSRPAAPPGARRHASTACAFVNDSKATNADSTAWALGCYDRVIWIAGGMAKEGGIAPLAPFFPRVAEALLIGRDAPDPGRHARRPRSSAPHRRDAGCARPRRASRPPRRSAAPVVLLSPACASWDQFTGFDQRGDRFRDLVAGLARRNA